MPDVMMIPAIASFFGVSTDELFDFHLYEVEKNVEMIVTEHTKYWNEPEKCEALLREGLQKYPGNEVLLNCLVGILPVPERAAEVIEICKGLSVSAKYDEVRIDAYRIMAQAYHSLGERTLCKEAIEHIPEIYFTKLEVASELLDGEEQYEAACRQRSLSFESMLAMCRTMARYHAEKGEKEKARYLIGMAKTLLVYAQNDFATPYSKSMFAAYGERLPDLEDDLKKLDA